MDVKKLEKQEAKLRVGFRALSNHPVVMVHVQAKIEKRARRDLYEGSKLLDQHRKQVGLIVAYQKLVSHCHIVICSKHTKNCL